MLTLLIVVFVVLALLFVRRREPPSVTKRLAWAGIHPVGVRPVQCPDDLSVNVEWSPRF